jgi:hypothetical protein
VHTNSLGNLGERQRGFILAKAQQDV